MNLWRLAGGLLTLVCLTWAGFQLPALGQGGDKDKEVKFAFKALGDKDKTFYQKLETTTTQDMSVEKQGQPAMKQVQKQTFIISWTPKAKTDKEYVVEQKIVYAQMNITIGTTQINYDSAAKDQPKNPMTEFFDSLMKVTLTLYINEADMKVTKVEGGKEFVDKLGESHPQMKNLLKSILSDEAIKQMSRQTWAAIPTKGVKKGESWPIESDLSLGAIGTYKNKYTYTFDGLEDKDTKAKFTVKPSMTYLAPTKVDKGEQLPFEIKSNSKLGSIEKDSTGTIYFDMAKGWISSSNIKMTVEGTVVIDIGGMETSVILKQTQESKLTTSADKDALMPSSAKK